MKTQQILVCSSFISTLCWFSFTTLPLHVVHEAKVETNCPHSHSFVLETTDKVTQRTVWRTRFGRVFGSVIRQNAGFSVISY
jgi:hypothetical protein